MEPKEKKKKKKKKKKEEFEEGISNTYSVDVFCFCERGLLKGAFAAVSHTTEVFDNSLRPFGACVHLGHIDGRLGVHGNGHRVLVGIKRDIMALNDSLSIHLIMFVEGSSFDRSFTLY